MLQRFWQLAVQIGPQTKPLRPMQLEMFIAILRPYCAMGCNICCVQPKFCYEWLKELQHEALQYLWVLPASRSIDNVLKARSHDNQGKLINLKAGL